MALVAPASAAEMIAPPGTKGAATCMPWRTTSPVRIRPLRMTEPKSVFGVCRVVVATVERRMLLWRTFWFSMTLSFDRGS